jgi:hypothetical protein
LVAAQRHAAETVVELLVVDPGNDLGGQEPLGGGDVQAQVDDLAQAAVVLRRPLLEVLPHRRRIHRRRAQMRARGGEVAGQAGAVRPLKQLLHPGERTLGLGAAPSSGEEQPQPAPGERGLG